MPDVDTSEFVEITHFINPHVLWLRKCNVIDAEFDGIESELQKYALRQHKKWKTSVCSKRIVRDDRVAVYFVEWKKWLRCDVDLIDSKCERCILWAIDYGFPLESAVHLVVPLEDSELEQKYTKRIMKAAISAVVPIKDTTHVSRTPIQTVPGTISHVLE